jgi:hypothetical protein
MQLCHDWLENRYLQFQWIFDHYPQFKKDHLEISNKSKLFFHHGYSWAKHEFFSQWIIWIPTWYQQWTLIDIWLYNILQIFTNGNITHNTQSIDFARFVWSKGTPTCSTWIFFERPKAENIAFRIKQILHHKKTRRKHVVSTWPVPKMRW